MKKYLALCLIGSCFFLTACGFTPIYGARGEGKASVQTSLNNIYINNISDERGQTLRNKLIDRLYFNGRPENPKARLSVNLTFSESNSGIQKDATSTRSQLRMNARFVLLSMDKKEELLSGVASTVASYSKLDAQYGTLATQRDAHKRAIIEISEQIVNRLSLFYAEKAPFEKKANNSK